MKGTEKHSDEQWKIGWEKAWKFYGTLRIKAGHLILEKQKEYVNELEQIKVEDLLLKGAFKIELTSSDGFSLIWSRRHFTIKLTQDDYGLDLTLINPTGEKLYQMSYGKIFYPNDGNCFNVIDEYLDIASRLQFIDAKIIGTNNTTSESAEEEFIAIMKTNNKVRELINKQ